MYGGDGIASVLLFDELLFEPRRVINVPPCKYNKCLSKTDSIVD